MTHDVAVWSAALWALMLLMLTALAISSGETPKKSFASALAFMVAIAVLIFVTFHLAISIEGSGYAPR